MRFLFVMRSNGTRIRQLTPDGPLGQRARLGAGGLGPTPTTQDRRVPTNA